LAGIARAPTKPESARAAVRPNRSSSALRGWEDSSYCTGIDLIADVGIALA
jgi:hypothetical protein